jgi:hypothetical protein
MLLLQRPPSFTNVHPYNFYPLVFGYLGGYGLYGFKATGYFWTKAFIGDSIVMFYNDYHSKSLKNACCFTFLQPL